MKRRWKMKLLKLLIACAVVCMQANGQDKDTGRIHFVPAPNPYPHIVEFYYGVDDIHKSYRFYDGNGNTLNIHKDGSLDIKGDTCALITHLIQFSNRQKMKAVGL